MIGAKKLSAIRKEIEEALASPGDDPIQRLERLIASANSKGDRTDLLEGLKRFLESARQEHRNQPGETRKRVRQEKARPAAERRD